MNRIERMQKALAREFPGLAMEVDRPDDPRGAWHLDIRPASGRLINVEWRPGRGFGISTPGADDYGVGPDEVYPGLARATERVASLIRDGAPADPSRRMRLSELRASRGLSQAELADRVGVKQANISRIERRNDLTLRTLHRLAAAMGARLVIHMQFPQGQDCEIEV